MIPEKKIAYGKQIRREMDTGQISQAFVWFAKYTTEKIKPKMGNILQTAKSGTVDEETHTKLILRLLQANHAKHAAFVAESMSNDNFKMSLKKFCEILMSVPCRCDVEDAKKLVNALCPLTKVVEHSDAATAGYFTKNARLLLTEFCEESTQILERIAKRPPAATDLVATASTWKGGRLCLSTKPQVGPDGVTKIPTPMSCLQGQINLDGKRILSGGDSVLVRKYVSPPKAIPQVRSFESLPDLSPEAADMYKETKTMGDGITLAEKQPPPPPPAPDSSLKASATAFVPKAPPLPVAPRPLDAPEVEFEEFEGIIEFVNYEQTEIHINLDHGEVKDIIGEGWSVDKLANRVSFSRQVGAMRDLLEIVDPTKKAKCTTNPAFRKILTAGFQYSEHAEPDEIDANKGGVTHLNEMKRSSSFAEGLESIEEEEVANLCAEVNGGRYEHVVRNVTRQFNLNESQQRAVSATLERRLSLIQGPPGTGKTHTSVAIVRGLIDIGRGPVLCTSDSNTAVDNLVEGLARAGVRVVRIGRTEAVRQDLAMYQIENMVPPGCTKHEAYEAQIRAVRYAQAVCCTCAGSGSDFLDRISFSAVMLDEASQVTEPMSLVPISRGCQQLVLVGDHKQLPPTILSREAELGGLTLSMFDRLVSLGVVPYMLDTQFRMHPALGKFPSDAFYDKQLKNGTPRAMRPTPIGFNWPQPNVPICYIPTHPTNAMENNDSNSYSNRAEAELVLAYLRGFLSAQELRPKDIGIVTPYAAQVRLLRQMIRRAGIQTGVDRNTGECGIEVSSVDGFQGREKELMIVSTVRANTNRSLGFVSDPRRCNVTLTRARRGLVVIGHENTLRCDRKVWGPYVQWMIESGLALGIRGRQEKIAEVNAIECDLDAVSRPFAL